MVGPSYLHFFFFMRRRPPTLTLFPYTTLFRSRSASRAGTRLCRRARIGKAGSRPACDGDRKSTRLNSSHRCISYAVFCLKKKKKERTGKRVGEKITPGPAPERRRTRTDHHERP